MEQLANRDSTVITYQAESVKEIYAMFRLPTHAHEDIYLHRN
jgi:hypothetical protein